MQRAAVGPWGPWQICPQEPQLDGWRLSPTSFVSPTTHPRRVLCPSCPALLEHMEEGDVHLLLLAAATAWAGAAGTKRKRRADYSPKTSS